MAAPARTDHHSRPGSENHGFCDARAVFADLLVLPSEPDRSGTTLMRAPDFALDLEPISS